MAIDVIIPLISCGRNLFRRERPNTVIVFSDVALPICIRTRELPGVAHQSDVIELLAMFMCQ